MAIQDFFFEWQMRIGRQLETLRLVLFYLFGLSDADIEFGIHFTVAVLSCMSNPYDYCIVRGLGEFWCGPRGESGTV